MRVITIQPASFTDNIWAGSKGEIIEGKKLPYPFHIDAKSGDVRDQDFWQGDPARVVGFQTYADRQQVDLWWSEAARNPNLAVGMYPVMVGPEGLYTYRVAIESVEINEVPA